MHLPITITVSLLTALGHSFPSPSPLDSVSVTFFDNRGWAGASSTFSVETQSQCYGLKGTNWTNRIRSLKVPSGYRCRLWDSNSCNGKSSPDIYPPGAKELGGMENKATSFKCYRN
ncbi:hypothetical protein CC78DRAFT_580656 [Lojkania enalia]|uniref:Beta/gamma crystallin 'Greek key' domain-containing protein n=1 Tax=Lojkania enalia TaxID=147567 RepID=A0A9P4MZU7_9PLEO|nr:hypothetical protein CC78DRAFT_580656 [Didymosphaeria enalia]